MVLPDGRINGLADAQAVIRAMWVANPASASEKLATLLALSGEDFEHVVERLYHERGWTTSMTARSGDGGWDLEVSLHLPGSRERSIVECKRWARHRVGVQIVRQLAGAWRSARATKRIIVTTRTFTRPARKEAAAQPQLELIDWDDLLPLLDEHLGRTGTTAWDGTSSRAVGVTAIGAKQRPWPRPLSARAAPGVSGRSRARDEAV
jgi:restriction system protein